MWPAHMATIPTRQIRNKAGTANVGPGQGQGRLAAVQGRPTSLNTTSIGRARGAVSGRWAVDVWSLRPDCGGHDGLDAGQAGMPEACPGSWGCAELGSRARGRCPSVAGSRGAGAGGLDHEVHRGGEVVGVVEGRQLLHGGDVGVLVGTWLAWP